MPLPSSFQRFRANLLTTRVVVFGIGVVTAIGAAAPSASAQPADQVTEVTEAHAQSTLFRALMDWNKRPALREAARGDALAAYAAECERATGIPVGRFSCSSGVEVPGQGTTPAGGLCNAPNVLNGKCDPGSRFQVLPGRTDDAVAVAHCRKVGLPIADSLYNDIAIIQYNKANGAVCFYQALTNLPGENIPAPSEGMAAPWGDGRGHWLSPAATHGIGCTRCHDNGGFIRSNYIGQLRTHPHAMPSVADGFDNRSAPLRFVGRDYASDRSWSVETANASGDTGPACSACHRLAVNNFPIEGGTALRFAEIATATTQQSKNPHSRTSPIWMRPGQIVHRAATEATARRYRDCAQAFRDSGFTAPPAGCAVAPLGEPYLPPPSLFGFGVGGDGRVWNAAWDGRAWSGWVPIEGGMFAQNTPISVISPGPNSLNLFGVGGDGRMWNAAWDGSAWSGWFPIEGGMFAQNTPISVVSLGPNSLNLFGVGGDGRVWDAAWDGSAWSGWFPIGDGLFAQNTPISVISPGPNSLNLFGVGGDGRVWNAAWDGSAWSGWFPIGDGLFAQNTPISVISPGPNSLNLFGVGGDGRVWNAAWDGSAWSGWFPIEGGMFAQNTPISVVSLGPNSLNLFGVGGDGRVWNAAWDGSAWSGWFPIEGGMFAQNTPISVVSLGPNSLNLFGVGGDGRVWNAAWDGSAWSGWFPIGDGLFAQNTPISVILAR